MKKFLTLVLALVLVFGLTVPAMAFTSDDSQDSSNPYELSIYLVEYDNNDFFGITTLPASDRGYAKNEIVAAVVELFVPKSEDPYDDGYRSLDISGDNVSFATGDASVASISPANNLTPKNPASDGFTMAIADNQLDGKDTFRWLVFAKVTDDEASLTAKLVDGTAPAGDFSSPYTFTVDGINFSVAKVLNTSYTITMTNGDYPNASIRIDINKDSETKGMYIDPNTTAGVTGDDFALAVNVDGELGIMDGAIVKTSGAAYDAVMDVYEDVCVDALGLDYFKIGNYMRDSFFEDITSGDTIVATVDIEPWTAYVTVPDNIVVDPPKTGDAASIMGFVMVALSGAGAVALKKRG